MKELDELKGMGILNAGLRHEIVSEVQIAHGRYEFLHTNYPR